jgi:S1/P1 Nuclease
VRQSELVNIHCMKNFATFFLFLILLPTSSLAWGPEGHRLVGDIARVRLTPTARLHVTELLGNDDLAAVSVWADDIKAERPETYGWHFVDIPMNATGFSEPRDCFRPDEKHPSTLQDHQNCVVDRIIMFKQVLADRSAPKQDRIDALKFLVHFVGDVHQPMHAMGEARGGNDIHVIEFGSSQCGKYACNLHFAWDMGLIEHTGLSETEHRSRLDQLIARRGLVRQADGTPERWADESFQLAKKVWLNDGGAVDEAYYKNDIGIIDQRLALAGIRLASLINQALGK